jgi:hypothetical protein
VLINTAAFVLISSGRQHPAQNCETPVIMDPFMANGCLQSAEP